MSPCACSLRQDLSLVYSSPADQQAWGCPASDLPRTGVVSMHHHKDFACGFWGLNPGLYACNANTSLTEPSSRAETKKKKVTEGFTDKADLGIQIRSV